MKLTLVTTVVRDFLDDDCPTMAAALAYYAVFSLPAVLFLLVFALGLVIDPRVVQERIIAELGGLVGSESGRQLETMVRSAQGRASGGGVGVLLSIAALIFGASGAFTQLQQALNRAWEVAPDPRLGMVKTFLAKRVLSLGIVLTLGFLLLVSLAVSALLAVLGDYIAGKLGGVSELILYALQIAVSFSVITVLFAVIFKVLPDAEIGWRDVWGGALITSALFAAGKFLIGYYLGRSEPGSVFGAAGALAVIMIWIYYSSMIVLLGAEITQAWAAHQGREIRPQKGAVRASGQ